MPYTRQNLTADLQMGVRCYQQGNIPAAITAFKRVLQFSPKHPDALHLLGIAYRSSGDTAEAVKLVKRAVKAQPKNAHYHHSLGLIQAERGKDREALLALRKAVTLSQGDSALHNDLGSFLSQRNRTEESIPEYRKAIRKDPSNIKALINLGHDLLKTGELEEARQSYERAVATDAGNINGQSGLAYALMAQGELDLAAEAYRRVLDLNPAHLEACNNLGSVFRKLGRLDEAENCFNRVIEKDPAFKEAWNGLGKTLKGKGEIDRALDCYQQALTIDPDYADARWSRALAELLLGRFESGWAGYEWRWKSQESSCKKRDFKQPLWDGASLEGKTLLLHAEQGNGDSIQFIRYISAVVPFGGRIIVECQRSLAPLFSTIAGIDCLVAAGDPLPDFDLQAPFLSLPCILGTRLESIPASVPYLAPGDRSISLDVADADQLKIGIVWAGSAEHENDRNRSVKLSDFAGLLDIPAIQLCSLQVGERAGDLETSEGGGQIVDVTAGISDYADTAALIEQLDLVISVDTSVAHLAGALAKPVWVLLPFAPDWRWLLDRSDSPWYPTMRLFRQKSAGDWEGVFADVAAALVELSGP